MLIRINLTALKAAAARNQKVEETVQDTRARMKELAARLDSAWDGGASRAAIDGLNSLSDQAARIAEGCGQSIQKLNGVAQAFEAADNGLSVLSRIAFPEAMRLVGSPSPFIDALLAVLGQLRIDPDEVRTVAHGCREVAEMYADSAAELQAMLSEVLGEWEGRSATRFADETHELISAFYEMQEWLAEYSDKLFSAAERYEELDNMLAN